MRMPSLWCHLQKQQHGDGEMWDWLAFSQKSSGALKELRRVRSQFDVCLWDPSCSHNITECVRISTNKD